MNTNRLYTRFYNMALRRLSGDSLGSPITITKESEGAFNPSTGAVVSTVESFETTGVKMAIKQYLVDGETILNADVHFYVSPVTTNGLELPLVTSTDTITFNNEKYVVVDTKPWDFNGNRIGQKVHARVSS